MQLDLFEDNRPGILLNIADEHIRLSELDKALSIYQQLAAEFPGDNRILPLMILVSEWHELLDNIPHTPEGLNDIWIRLETVQYPVLRSKILELLCEGLLSLPEPEKIFVPPSLHLGNVCMLLGRHTDAAGYFKTALFYDEIPRGRFLVWRGNALTLAGEHDSALESYLTAFLDAPRTIEINTVVNQTIHRLHVSFHYEDEDIDEDDEIAWLPVWGWLNAVFTLPLHSVSSSTNTENFAELLEEGMIPVPRIWFDMLTYSEHLRTVSRDDKELVAVRRLMRQQNRYFFELYMNKLRGT